jgi:hypothetical protein
VVHSLFLFIDLRDKKGGLQITSYLRYCSIKEGTFLPPGVSKHIKKSWVCDACKMAFIFNLDEIVQHKKTHELTTNVNAFNPQELEKEYEKQLVEKDGVNTGQSRTRYLCEECDKFYLFTPTDILRHKKTHKTD